MSIGALLRAGEWWPIVFAGVMERFSKDTPRALPGLEAVTLDRPKFTEAETDWMQKRAGFRCECVAQDCHKPSAHRLHSDIDGRCLGDFTAASVQAQGDHLIARALKGATDPVLNGMALCGPCNQFKSDKEWGREWIEWVAENRQFPAWEGIKAV